MSNNQKSGLRWVAGPATPSKVYITRVLNYGTWAEWCQVKQRYTPAEILDAIQNPLPGQWTRRGKLLAETMYNCQLPDETLISYGA